MLPLDGSYWCLVGNGNHLTLTGWHDQFFRIYSTPNPHRGLRICSKSSDLFFDLGHPTVHAEGAENQEKRWESKAQIARTKVFLPLRARPILMQPPVCSRFGLLDSRQFTHEIATHIVAVYFQGNPQILSP